MKTKLLQKENARSLTIFFAGWGCDASMLADITSSSDVLFCYDYHTWNNFCCDDLISTYKNIRLVAWSFGVWVAKQCLHNVPLTEAVAFNGTLSPIDDHFGIKTTIFDMTLSKLDEHNLMKFRRRMCGKEYEHYMKTAPTRNVDDLRGELQALHDGVKSCGKSSSKFWTKAVITTNDLIFPRDNQVASWKSHGVKTVEIKGAHYSYNIIKELLT